MTKIWPLRPNWSSPYEISYQFSTEILTSESRREQRRALRSEPRRHIEFKVTTWAARFRTLMAMFERTQGDLILLPEVTAGVKTASPVNNSASVTLSSVPAWILPGATAILLDGEQAVSGTILSRAGNVVTMTAPLAGAWRSGSMFCPGLSGRISEDQSATVMTDRIAEAGLSFDVDPGSELWPEVPAAPTTWNGREVFTDLKPDWSSDKNYAFTRGTSMIDYGKGRVRSFQKSSYGNTTMQADYNLNTRAKAALLINFFLRQKGRRGEFYMPLDTADMQLVSAVGSFLYVEGAEIAEAYADDAVNKSICIRKTDGTRLFRKVLGITVHGTQSRIQLDQAASVTPQTAEVISWMPVCRMASDDLTVQWQTDTVATARLNIMSLEDLPAE